MRKTVALMGALLLAALPAIGAFAAGVQGKKVLYVDSYHVGYEWSDGITRGVQDGLKGAGVDIKIVRMDTKRNKDEAFKAQAGDKVKAIIEEYKPDVVILSDDNAVKYVLAKHYKDAALPFVFCGLNWDASIYNLPYKNTTGMIEVSSIGELVKMLEKFGKGNRIGVLTEDTETEHKETSYYKNRLGLNLVEVYAADFADWKKKYSEIQDKVDVLVLGNTASMTDWNEQEANQYALAHAKVPSGALQEGPMPRAMVGYLKVAEEQGQWSAEQALRILAGTAPASIKVTENKEGKLKVNIKMTEKLGILLPFELLQGAEIIK